MRYTHSKEAVTNANYSHYDIPPSCSPLCPLVPLTQLCCCRSESLGERPGRAAPVPGVRAGDEE